MAEPESDQDVRWRQRLQSFRRALSQLSRAVTLAGERDLTELERQGLIQAFEFTHELAWKTLKDFLEARGVTDIFGSKDATREAFARGLIENGDHWMGMIRSRNKSSHTYNVGTADEIAEAITTCYFPAFEQVLTRLAELEGQER